MTVGERATVAMRVAAISYVERADGRILCVWNRRYGGWSLPGGMCEDGETPEHAQSRELREETGIETVSAALVHEGPPQVHAADPSQTRGNHVMVYMVTALGVPHEVETGCPVTWLTREEFLRWTPFAVFYAKAFQNIPVVDTTTPVGCP